MFTFQGKEDALWVWLKKKVSVEEDNLKEKCFPSRISLTFSMLVLSWVATASESTAM